MHPWPEPSVEGILIFARAKESGLKRPVLQLWLIPITLREENGSWKILVLFRNFLCYLKFRPLTLVPRWKLSFHKFWSCKPIFCQYLRPLGVVSLYFAHILEPSVLSAYILARSAYFLELRRGIWKKIPLGSGGIWIEWVQCRHSKYPETWGFFGFQILQLIISVQCIHA